MAHSSVGAVCGSSKSFSVIDNRSEEVRRRDPATSVVRSILRGIVFVGKSEYGDFLVGRLKLRKFWRCTLPQ